MERSGARRMVAAGNEALSHCNFAVLVVVAVVLYCIYS